jgi:hypothetical protein
VVQHWERTDLRVLVTLGIGGGEDPWTVGPEGDDEYIVERQDADFMSSSYREDPRPIGEEYRNPALNAVREGGGLVAGSLRRLVVDICADPGDEQRRQLMTAMPVLTSRAHFVEHLSKLMEFVTDTSRPDYSPEKDLRTAIQLIGFLKSWLKDGSIGQSGLEALRRMLAWLGRSCPVEEMRTVMGGDLFAALLKRADDDARRDDRRVVPRHPPLLPNPMALFQNPVDLFELDPVEVARQITLIAHGKLSAVHPQEVWESMQRGALWESGHREGSAGIVRAFGRDPTLPSLAPQLQEFFKFRDRLRRLCARALVEPGTIEERRSALGHWLDIAKALSELRNFDSSSAILEFIQTGAGRNSSADVLFVCGAEESHATIFGELLGKCGLGSPVTAYDSAMSEKVPTVPNMGAELRRAHEQQEAEPHLIDGLINWRRLRMMAAIVVRIADFSKLPYDMFVPVPQIVRALVEGPVWSQATIEKKLEDCRHLVDDV